MRRLLILIILPLAGCATATLKPGADEVKKVDQPPACCILVERFTSHEAPLFHLNPKGAEENLTIHAKNFATKVGADTVLVKKVDGTAKTDLVYRADLYSCKPPEKADQEALARSCELKDARGCLAAAAQAKSRQDYQVMIASLRRACEGDVKAACDWTKKFEAQKTATPSKDLVDSIPAPSACDAK